MCTTYERKTRGPREGTEGKTPIQINVIVDPITPCDISTPKRAPSSRQMNFSGRRTSGQGSSQETSNEV
jgi:hypothetical protein